VPIEIQIPGGGQLSLTHLLLDVNGTLSNRGVLLDGVESRVRLLSQHLEVHLLSADTFGTAEQTARRIGASFRRVIDGREKVNHADHLGPAKCAAIGNGSNDALMLERCALGIAVLGPEGTSADTLRSADVVCRSIEEALELLLSPRALVASLRA
jgi:soluble P-type ATPase